MSQQIFQVIVSGVNAELEVYPDRIFCKTENTVHFDISKDEIRNFIHTSPKNIMINFYQDGNKLQVNVKSKYCLSLMKALTEINRN